MATKKLKQPPKTESKPTKDEIIQNVLDGMAIGGLSCFKACQAAGVPNSTFMRWVDADAKLAERYAHAREDLIERMANEVLELAELDGLGFDVELTGFSDEEIKALMPVEVTEGLTDPDDAPAVQENPVTVPGDVWVMGKHRLLCGDSTSVDDLAKLTQGTLVDMWLTDPPYNVAYEGGTKEKLTIKNDSMGDDQFRQFLRDAYTAADTVMKPGAVFYIWHADIEGYNFRGAAKDAGWAVRQCLIWKKSSLVLGRQDYQSQHEPCLYGWKEGASHLWASDRKQTTILEFDKPSRNGEHPTMKPVALFEYQLLNNTKGGDMVLDSFGGSGTTLIAAEKNGRIARIMELDPKYCDVILQRYVAFVGTSDKVFLSTDDGDIPYEEVLAMRKRDAK
jgi:site-specific DNA-methyltransferase (adenine-specific)